MKRFLQNLFGTSNSTKTSKQSYRPRLEGLEDRRLNAVSVSYEAATSVLRIVGDNAANTIAVVQDDSQDRLDVFNSAYSSTVPMYSLASSQVVRVTAQLLDGNDNFSYRLASGTDLVHRKGIEIHGGFGDDGTFLEFYSRDGTSQIRANLNVSVLDVSAAEAAYYGRYWTGIDMNDRAGTDSVFAGFGSVVDAGLSLVTNLGLKEDYVEAYLLGNLEDGADAYFQLMGQGNYAYQDYYGVWRPLYDGDDFFGVGVYGHIEDSDSVLQVIASGGDGEDIVVAEYAGEVDGSLIIGLSGGNNNDDIGAQIRLYQDSEGSLNAILSGDNGNDDMALLLFGAADSEFSFVNKKVRGGAGLYDEAYITDNVDTETVEDIYPA